MEEGYIGHLCSAARGWGAESDFARDSKRVMDQFKIDRLLDRHSAAKADLEVPERIARTRAESEALSKEISSLRGKVPGPVFLRLRIWRAAGALR